MLSMLSLWHFFDIFSALVTLTFELRPPTSIGFDSRPKATDTLNLSLIRHKMRPPSCVIIFGGFTSAVTLTLIRSSLSFTGYIASPTFYLRVQYDVPMANCFGDISLQTCSPCYPYGTFSPHFQCS